MRKLFFIFATIMIFFQITATTCDDSPSIIKKIKTFFKKKIEIANANLERFNPIISGVKEEYRGCLQPTLSVPVYNGDTLYGNLNTPIAGLVLASHISFGLLISSPQLKLGFLAALLAPYATEVCAKTTAQNILRANSYDSPYMISDIVAQNTLIATHGN